MIVKSTYTIPTDYIVFCNSADEFLKNIYPSSGMWNDEQKRWIFRGQPAKFNLTPSAFRGNALSNLTCYSYYKPSPAKQVALELRALKSFLDAADRQGILVPGDSREFRKKWINEEVIQSVSLVKTSKVGFWPDNAGIQALTFAQQSGLPTRLLDWTKRSYIAAYFAATGTAMRAIYDQDESEVCDDMAVWAFSNEHLYGYTNPKMEIIDVPTGLNQNLVLQRGCFTLVKTLIKGEVAKEYCFEEAVSKNDKKFPGKLPLRKFVLRSDQRKRLLRLLSECEGIDGASMFSGIEGAMKYIKEKAHWLGKLEILYP